jgi:hypothetical protein
VQRWPYENTPRPAIIIIDRPSPLLDDEKITTTKEIGAEDAAI